MINSLLLNYTRYFPFEYGKNALAPFIKFPDGPVEYTTRLGGKFMLDTKEYQMKQIYCYDLYEKNTVRHLVKLISSDHVFFDVGSNLGFYAITFARLLKNGSVHCFEPNTGSFERLKANVEINQLNNVVLNNVGLSDEERDLMSSYNLSNTGTASVYNKNNELKEIVHLIKLDDYCNRANSSRINLVKVDIEGGEYAFLKGGEYTIKNNKKLILVVEMMDENFSNAGYSSDDFFDYIIGLGFKAYLPRPFPFKLKQIDSVPGQYSDNIIFLRGY